MAEIKTITYENCVVRIHIPDFTEDEQKDRQKKIEKATAHFMMQVRKEEGEFHG